MGAKSGLYSGSPQFDVLGIQKKRALNVELIFEVRLLKLSEGFWQTNCSIDRYTRHDAVVRFFPKKQATICFDVRRQQIMTFLSDCHCQIMRYPTWSNLFDGCKCWWNIKYMRMERMPKFFKLHDTDIRFHLAQTWEKYF